MAKTRLSSKYQIVVPKVAREKLNLKPGTKLIIYPIDNDRLIVMKEPKDYVKALRGLGKEVWQALGGTEKYLREERASWGDR